MGKLMTDKEKKVLDRKLEYHNAQITGTVLGFEDHGIFTFFLQLEFDGGGVGFGGYSLDSYDKEKQERIGVGLGIDCIKEIMATVGVQKWEDIRGRHVVMESEGVGGRCIGIRNLLKEDKWFRPQAWFEERLAENGES